MKYNETAKSLPCLSNRTIAYDEQFEHVIKILICSILLPFHITTATHLKQILQNCNFLKIYFLTSNMRWKYLSIFMIFTIRISFIHVCVSKTNAGLLSLFVSATCKYYFVTETSDTIMSKIFMYSNEIILYFTALKVNNGSS